MEEAGPASAALSKCVRRGFLPYIQTGQSSQTPCVIGECPRSVTSAAKISLQDRYSAYNHNF